MNKTNVEKLNILLMEKGYPEKRRKNAIGYITGFFKDVKKSPKNVTEDDVKEYLKNSKNTHQKFWVNYFYTNLQINFIHHHKKLSRLEQKMNAIGMEAHFELIEDIYNFSKKAFNRITENDVEAYIKSNNITGDDLIKIKSISKIFIGVEKRKENKIIILNKNQEAVSYNEVKEKLSHVPDIRGMIEKARELDRHYCIKINSMVKVCKVGNCSFYSYTCPINTPLCSAHTPDNILKLATEA